MTITSYLLSIFFSIVSLLSYGQTEEYMHDIRESIERKSPSMVSDTSSLNLESRLAGYELVDVVSSPCFETLLGKHIKERVVRKDFRNDTLEIEVAIIANCCSSFLGEIQIENDTTMNIIFTSYGEECMCTCCFNLEYQIITEQIQLSTFKLNGKPIVETDQVLRQEYIEEEYYENGMIKTKTLKLDDEVILVHHYNLVGKRIQTDYYFEGKLQKEIKF